MTGTWGNGFPGWLRASRPLWVLLVVLLLVPMIASADEQEEAAQEELEMGLPLSLEGELDAFAGRGAFTMGPLPEPAQEFALQVDAATADVSVVTTSERSLTGSSIGDRVVVPKQDRPRSENYEFQDVSIRLEEAEAGFYLLAHTDPEADHGTGMLSMRPLSQKASLEGQEDGRQLSHVSEPDGNQHYYAVHDEMLGFVGDDPLTVVHGDFTLLLYETTFNVQHSEGSRTIETGESREGTTSDVVPAGLPVDPLVRHRSVYAVLELEDARLALKAVGTGSEIVAPYDALRIDVNGSVEAPSLLGVVQMDDQLVRMQGDAARMEGEFTMKPTSPKGDGKAAFSFQGDVQTIKVGQDEYRSEADVKKAAGMAIALAGVGAVLWHVAKSGVLVPLYAKLTRRKVLDQATRQQVHDKVREDPGCTTRSVSSALGISWSTAAYHLRVLRHMDLITAKRQGRHDHYFITGESTQSQQVVQAALQNPTTRRIARLVADRPGIIQKDVCEALGISPSTASDHLKRLRESGAVREERQWRTRAYYPAQVIVGHGHNAFYEDLPLPVAGTAGTTA